MITRGLFFLFLLVISGLAQANLYNCQSSQGKPILSKEQPQISTIIHQVDPFLQPHYQSNKYHQNKTPFLVYYAIDSAEAFMQYAVKYELAKLQEKCLQNPQVNFVGIVNSLYVEKNQIVLCKNQKSSLVDLKTFPQLNQSLKQKRKFISTGDHTGDELGPLRYLVKYAKQSNKAFGNFPLAHPDFLHDLLELVITDKSFFPAESYMPFLHLKSHGSNSMVLAGLHECQTKAKVLSAKKVVNSILTKQEQKLLNNSSAFTGDMTQLPQIENVLDKLYLSSKSGLGDFHMGDVYMGDFHMGDFHMGNALVGLGANEGLGVSFSFGSYHLNLNWVLSNLFDNDTNRVLGFVMLESCDTNRNPHFFHAYLDNVLGVYSAKYSLWYRNLNWWSLLENAEGSTLNLMNQLKEQTAQIRNLEVIKK